MLQVAKNLHMWSTGSTGATYSELLANDSDVAKVVHLLTGSLEGLRQQTTEYLSELMLVASACANDSQHLAAQICARRYPWHAHTIGVQRLLASLISCGRLIFKQTTRPS